MQGLLTFLDPPRPDTKETVRLSRVNGVAVKMITGDHLLIAMETARVLDMGDCIRGMNIHKRYRKTYPSSPLLVQHWPNWPHNNYFSLAVGTTWGSRGVF